MPKINFKFQVGVLLAVLISNIMDMLPTISMVAAQQNQEINVVSCTENNVNPGSVVGDCETLCVPITGEYNATDFSSGPTDDDPSVIRTLSCNCSEAGIFNCLEQYEVFNTDEHEVKEDCGEYNITSGNDCIDYCSEIDPAAYDVAVVEGKVTYCDCGEGRQICGDSDTASVSVFGDGLLALWFIFWPLSSFIVW